MEFMVEIHASERSPEIRARPPIGTKSRHVAIDETPMVRLPAIRFDPFSQLWSVAK
jgi:hypothetical protein